MDERRNDAMAPRPDPTPRALLAGGGTGGHVFPALALADELGRRGWSVSLAGRAGGLEERLAGERGLRFHPLPARPLLGRGPLDKARALATLGRSAWAAARLIRELDAQVVVGTGGYVSAPAVLGARLARRPVLLLEPNARPGVANRWLSRLATEAAVGYPAAAGELRCPSVVTGVPVRDEFFAVPAELPGGTARLLVLGGSQGARQVNELMAGAAVELLRRIPGLSIVHQAGARNVEEAREHYRAAGSLTPAVEIVPFLADVAGAMAASHLLVSRAGAITIAEICAAGRPALFIPLAIAEAHQVDNARVLAESGAAELVTPEEARRGAAPLADRLEALLIDRERLSGMARAARALARPDAVRALADRLEARIAHPSGERAA
jgi:UDP-N-acetylglucosamine--N-acetylmuramyl-(pentapeptide) pyrophosphoryl-undecaprenol N-acetylglucosamine transferase